MKATLRMSLARDASIDIVTRGRTCQVRDDWAQGQVHLSAKYVLESFVDSV